MGTKLTDLFLSPHFDDETLFGSFSICAANDIDVAVCYIPTNVSEQTVRIRETTEAISILGANELTVLSFLDPIYEKNTNFERIEDRLQILNTEKWYENVFAPKWEYNGNPDHNQLSDAAHNVFEDRVTYYTTYTWPEGKTRTNNIVPVLREWTEKKIRALACHKSQILRPETSVHFMEDLWEYYA